MMRRIVLQEKSRKRRAFHNRILLGIAVSPLLHLHSALSTSSGLDVTDSELIAEFWQSMRKERITKDDVDSLPSLSESTKKKLKERMQMLTGEENGEHQFKLYFASNSPLFLHVKKAAIDKKRRPEMDFLVYPRNDKDIYYKLLNDKHIRLWIQTCHKMIKQFPGRTPLLDFTNGAENHVFTPLGTEKSNIYLTLDDMEKILKSFKECQSARKGFLWMKFGRCQPYLYFNSKSHEWSFQAFTNEKRFYNESIRKVPPPRPKPSPEENSLDEKVKAARPITSELHFVDGKVTEGFSSLELNERSPLLEDVVAAEEKHCILKKIRDSKTKTFKVFHAHPMGLTHHLKEKKPPVLLSYLQPTYFVGSSWRRLYLKTNPHMSIKELNFGHLQEAHKKLQQFKSKNAESDLTVTFRFAKNNKVLCEWHEGDRDILPKDHKIVLSAYQFSIIYKELYDAIQNKGSRSENDKNYHVLFYRDLDINNSEHYYDVYVQISTPFIGQLSYCWFKAPKRDV